MRKMKRLFNYIKTGLAGSLIVMLLVLFFGATGATAAHIEEAYGTFYSLLFAGAVVGLVAGLVIEFTTK